MPNQIAVSQIIRNILSEMYENHKDNYDFDMEDNYVPYGSTFVSTGYEPTYESEQRCLEDFKKKHKEDLSFFVDELINSNEFSTYLENIIDSFEG